MPPTVRFERHNWFIVSLKSSLTTITCCDSETAAQREAEEIRLNYGVVLLVCSGDELLKRIMTEPAE